MADELRQTILDYVRREYLDADDDSELTAQTPLISSGIVDSFSMVSLKRFLEKRFGIQIADADADAQAFDTVERIAALVERIRSR